MKQSKNISLKLAALAWGISSTLDASPLTDRMIRSNQLFLAQEPVRALLVDPVTRQRLNQWLTHYKNESYVVDCQLNLRPFFRDVNTVGPLCYYLRQDAPQTRSKYLEVAKAYVYEVGAAIAELVDDPRYADAERSKAKQWTAAFQSFNPAELDKCFRPVMSTTWPKAGEPIGFSPFSKVASCLNQSMTKVNGAPFFAVNLAKEFPNHPGHAVSPTGWVAGNKVTYLTWNDTTIERRNELEARHGQMVKYYPLTGAGSLESMRKKDLSTVFSSAEGFFTMANDPIWNQEKAGAIFPEIRKSLDRAKSTIFVDIFFLGSSMGASLAKHLVSLAENGIKVLVLRDNYNHFGHEPQMLPVFNYLAAYSEKNPTRMVISGSYIKGHTSGLPQLLSPIVTDTFLEKSGVQQHLSLYGKAQSDHSKVFVIDGKTDAPVAFVGSKNFTDASGAVVMDEVAKIEGPAASLVQDDFYWDMAHALRYEMPESHLNILASKGWSANQFKAGQTRAASVSQILKPFDFLNRSESGVPSADINFEVPSKGSAIVRTGMNNVNSTRTNCVDQVIQMIAFAQKNIFIKDQYLFDRNVILALLTAKSKRPSLDIRAILEPLNRANPKGLPNLLYLDYLKTAGIPVRIKHIMEGSIIHSEYHMKTISADGRSVITGSANKDQSTMYGSFREEQVDIWDSEATRVHDDIFLSHWNDQESDLFTGYNFAVPYDLKGVNGKPLQPAQFIASVRDIISILFDAR